jgi:hypothetical protein
MNSDFRRFPRYFLPSGLPAVLTNVEANVVDLSVKGARLQTTQPLAVGAKMHFALTASGSTIATDATVLWCQMAALALDDDESDRYLAGIVFEDAVPTVNRVIDNLIAHDEAIAIEDARSCERYGITAPQMASFGDRGEVKILDLCIRGARIGSREAVTVGTQTNLRFRLEPGPSVDVVATAMWCKPSERKHGYEIGLYITGEEPLLRAVIAQLCMKKQARVDLNSLRRKFDPMRSMHMSGLVALAS